MKIKTLREDAQLAVRKMSLCEPLVRGEFRERDSFLLPGKLKNDIISAEHMDR